MGSFRKRFNETKRGVSRKLSRRQSSRNRKKSIDSESCCPETPQSFNECRRGEPQETGNSFELDGVLECDSNDASSRQETDVNPALIANGELTGGILTDDKNGKNINPMLHVIPEQSLRLEEDSCESNEADPSTEVEDNEQYMVMS